MAGETLAPIIVRKKKIIMAGGHHGGAWKVAYADFVTAMMAFFLLMWLLNATTEKQRMGLADYFSPTIPIHRSSGGGDGAFFGSDVYSEDALPQTGNGAALLHPTEHHQSKGDSGVTVTEDADTAASQEAPLQTAEDLLETLKARGGESMTDLLKSRHIVTRLTDEGLIIEMFDLPGEPLFDPVGGEMTAVLDDTLALVAELLKLVENDIAVRSYLAARPLVLVDNPVWEITSWRADQARLRLEAQGLGRARTERIAGHADRDPVTPDPMDIRNNRIEVVVLRDEA